MAKSKRAEAKVEWQHFRMRNVLSGELKEIRIGPVPISAMKMPALMKKACKEAGIPFGPDHEGWLIDKAWVGP